MRQDRFFVNFEIKEKITEISDKNFFHQIRNVLRKRVGEEIILFDGKKEARAEIEKFLKDKIIIKIVKIGEKQTEPETFVSLYCSVLKKSNFELVVQKTTEIGVKEIVPILCKNTVKLSLKFERLEKIAKEASEQSGRISLPKIEKILSFKEAVERAKDSEFKILFDILGKDLSQIQTKNFKKVSLFVGPEGGWDKEEIKLVQKENFEILNLGKLNLRAETAAIVATFLVQNFLAK
jgi:16S rRNA (uracil1498-N3)-methyltransferase